MGILNGEFIRDTLRKYHPKNNILENIQAHRAPFRLKVPAGQECKIGAPPASHPSNYAGTWAMGGMWRHVKQFLMDLHGSASEF